MPVEFMLLCRQVGVNVYEVENVLETLFKLIFNLIS